MGIRGPRKDSSLVWAVESRFAKNREPACFLTATLLNGFNQRLFGTLGSFLILGRSHNAAISDSAHTSLNACASFL